MVNKFYCRSYQLSLKMASKFLAWRKPVLITGSDSILELANIIMDKGLKKVLIVTDKIVMNLGLLNGLIEQLIKCEIGFEIFDNTVQNPTIDNIEEALKLYIDAKCKAIIGFGGGSAIDCAKAIGARVVNPNKSLSMMKGILKVGKKLPPLFAVPTTAGTGSEATLAAVVTDPRSNDKYSINDVVLIPNYAILDPQLSMNLPKQLTATTGMDALTHAIEAYIGKSNTKNTRIHARKAIIMIVTNLEESYNNPSINSRENMLMASFYAGLAFTRAYVGNVHAIAHTFGGFYNIPHGLANAIILPYVLKYYGKKAEKSLAELADLTRLTNAEDSNSVKANKFIDSIIQLNNRMNIPKKIRIPNLNNLDLMIDRAYHEANPLYPVPMIFAKNDFRNIYEQVIETYENGDKDNE